MRGEAAGGAGKPGAPGMRYGCAGWVQQGPPKHAGSPEPPPGPVLFHSSAFSFSFFPFCYGTIIGNWVMKEAGRGTLFLAFKNA